MPAFVMEEEKGLQINQSRHRATAQRGGYLWWVSTHEWRAVKDKYGEDAVNKLDDNDESSSDEENENAKELTEEFERDFLKTLSYLKKKDPCIYDKDTKFFEEYKSTLKQDGASEEKSKKQEKSLFLRDYERKLILEKGGKFTDDEDDAHYLEWLKGQKEELLDKKMESELKPLHDFWNDPQLDESLSGDEHTLGQQEEFERKFNFRFEEPDSEFTKRYPRVMEHSLRKKDDRRKLKREELKKRKQEEKVRKREELKRLRAMKRKEIETKLEKLKEITGNKELGFKDEDLEGEFNPAEYDKRMKELFSDEYYKEEDYSQKPEFPDIDEELEIENWERWRGEDMSQVDNGNEYQPHCEDPDFNMDCDYDPKAQFQEELIESTRRRKKGRRRSKLAQLLAKKKPVFEPNERTFDEYVNEYYKMDFEDVIGDLPCRFKYRNVVPNSFGLTTDEILSAKDKELNQWVSLGKAVQYRPETKELYDVKAYQNKAKNIKLKEKCLASLYSGEKNEEKTPEPGKKKKRRKRKKNDSTAETSEKAFKIQRLDSELMQTELPSEIQVNKIPTHATKQITGARKKENEPTIAIQSKSQVKEKANNLLINKDEIETSPSNELNIKSGELKQTARKPSVLPMSASVSTKGLKKKKSKKIKETVKDSSSNHSKLKLKRKKHKNENLGGKMLHNAVNSEAYNFLVPCPSTLLSMFNLIQLFGAIFPLDKMN
uniref:Protein KRI1 homolog n=1 Tax=Timema genevievae TaxID=629358 RepID=A0A7R9PGS6_TIMGE|nr:unnamed protein product [Timema genevievae]